jgi:hypothetical protein
MPDLVETLSPLRLLAANVAIGQIPDTVLDPNREPA